MSKQFPFNETVHVTKVLCLVDGKAFPNGLAVVFHDDGKLTVHERGQPDKQAGKKPFKSSNVTINQMTNPTTSKTTIADHPYIAVADGLKIPLSERNFVDFNHLLSRAKKQSSTNTPLVTSKHFDSNSGSSSAGNTISGSKSSGVVNRNINSGDGNHRKRKIDERNNTTEKTSYDGSMSKKSPLNSSLSVLMDISNDDPIEDLKDNSIRSHFSTAAPLHVSSTPTLSCKGREGFEAGTVRKTFALVQSAESAKLSQVALKQRKANINSQNNQYTAKPPIKKDSNTNSGKYSNVNYKRNEPSDYASAIRNNGSSDTCHQSRNSSGGSNKFVATSYNNPARSQKIMSSYLSIGGENKTGSNNSQDNDSGIPFSDCASEKSSFEGIRNDGNTCYIGASMQALLHLTIFKKIIVSRFWQNLSTTDTIISSPCNFDGSGSGNGRTLRSSSLHSSNTCLYQFLQLAKEIDNSSTKSIGGLKKVVDTKVDRFKGYYQHDAHEFLSDFLGFLHDDCSAKVVSLFKMISGDRSEIVTLDENELSNNNEHNNSVSKEIFNDKNESDVNNPSLVIEIKDKENDDNFKTNTYRNDDSTDLYKTPLALKNRSAAGSITTKSDTSTNMSPENKTDSEESAMPSILIPFLPTYTCFHSEVEVSLVCNHCGQRKEKRVEMYRDFSIELSVNEEVWAPASSDKANSLNIRSGSSDTLESLLKSFFCSEIREVQCEKCNTSSGTAMTENKILCLPKYLIIHLKRFVFDYSLSRFVKDSKCITFPKKLSMNSDICKFSDEFFVPSMTPYVINSDLDSTTGEEILTEFLRESESIDTRRFVEPTSCADWSCQKCTSTNAQSNTQCSMCQTKKAENSVTDYHLATVIRHLGSDLSSGHYICDVRTRDDTRDRWSRCDDSTVAEISEKKVFGETDSPYILIFERIVD